MYNIYVYQSRKKIRQAQNNPINPSKISIAISILYLVSQLIFGCSSINSLSALSEEELIEKHKSNLDKLITVNITASISIINYI